MGEADNQSFYYRTTHENIEKNIIGKTNQNLKVGFREHRKPKFKRKVSKSGMEDHI